tara:strand:- start:4126 stop:4419 length:294 start_codon:yes stop_codon:yes gene_type:complete
MAYTHKMVNGEKVPLTDSEIEELEARDVEWAKGAYDRAIAGLRMERDNKLAQSDWMANSDVTMSSDWKTYRQELRDLTKGLDTEDKVNKVTWPKEPS